MKAKVDQETCVGCGICPSICSDVFFMKADGKAHAIDESIPSSLEDEAKDAEASCPVNAIEIN